MLVGIIFFNHAIIFTTLCRFMFALSSQLQHIICTYYFTLCIILHAYIQFVANKIQYLRLFNLLLILLFVNVVIPSKYTNCLVLVSFVIFSQVFSRLGAYILDLIAAETFQKIRLFYVTQGIRSKMNSFRAFFYYEYI